MTHRIPEAKPGDDATRRAVEEPPPLLGRWWRLYALVIGALGVMIALLAWLTRIYG